MVSWALIILIIIGLVIFFKTTGVRFGATWTVIVGILILFFVVSFGYVVTQVEDVNSFEGLTVAMKAYVFWLGGAFDNAAGITGNVINTDWDGNLSDNLDDRDKDDRDKDRSRDRNRRS